MTRTGADEALAPPGIVAIVRLRELEPPDALLDALVAGGVRHVEVTIGTPGAMAAIERWRRRDRGVRIGVGTALDLPDVRRAAEAGAEFVVCPHLDTELVEFCRRSQLAVFPGAGTVTEVVQAWRAGATAVKLFPVHSFGGPGFVRALAGPLPGIPLLPTGGVDHTSATEYARLGCAGVGVGSALVDEGTVGAADWPTLQTRAARLVDAWNRGREGS